VPDRGAGGGRLAVAHDHVFGSIRSILEGLRVRVPPVMLDTINARIWPKYDVWSPRAGMDIRSDG
jgi:hypothetical protein